jgi:hypothetical protein
MKTEHNTLWHVAKAVPTLKYKYLYVQEET